MIAVVAASIVAGFFVVGSPLEERVRRFDDRRTTDLQFIQSEIINHWTNKERLPVNLSELRDNIRGISIPRDPETNLEYEYAILNNLAFSLCATFSRPSRNLTDSMAPQPIGDPYQNTENWEHKEGYTCFERTIDPDIYRPKTRVPAND